MKNVIIIDDDAGWCTTLSGYINCHSEFLVVATALNGQEGALLVDHHRPDLIILDIIMPGDDGIRVIKHIHEKCEQYTPVIYVITGVKSRPILRMLHDLAVDFIDLKPVYSDTIGERLNQIDSYLLKSKKTGIVPTGKTDITDIVESVLEELAIPLHIAGYKYTKAILYLMMDNPDVKLDIYGHISKICQCSMSSAERNLRTAVEASKNSGLYRELFGVKRVRNLVFLHGIAKVVSKRARESEKQ